MQEVIDRWVKDVATASNAREVVEIHSKLQEHRSQYPDFVRLVTFSCHDRFAAALAEVYAIPVERASRYLV